MDSRSAPEYYPVGGSYYGYYPTAGPEQLGVMEDHQSNSDLQDIYYPTTGSQNGNLPYTYYTPNPGYGYPQSPYNPYNPYIPSSVGTDSQMIGTQQYFTNPSYEQFAPSAYIPATIQSNLDNIMYNPSVPSVVNIGMPNAGCMTDSLGTQHLPLASANLPATYQRFALGHPVLEAAKLSSNQVHTSANLSNGLFGVAESNQYLSHGSMAVGGVPHVSQTTNNFSNVRVPSGDTTLSVTTPGHAGYTSYGSTVPQWSVVDDYKPRFQYNRALTNGQKIPYILGDQHRGPRSKGSNNGAPSVTVQTSNQAGNVNRLGNISKHTNQYNRPDFVTDYPVAKFFVIKSYTEDDVHKSIKYNVWSSTPYGNKKLDNAYEDAQRISMGKSRKCPVFLFFSVNASGRFCGVAEMIGRVDFYKNMDFWHQDKWIGSFPVKWHIIKDVPNTSLRHILLENNEFTPVTSSRDTQEVTYIPGMAVLEIFKYHLFISSLLDDIMYYDERERIMREQRSRLLGRNPAAPIFVPVRGASNGSNSIVAHPPTSFYRPVKSAAKETSGEVLEPPQDKEPQDDAREIHQIPVSEHGNGEQPAAVVDVVLQNGNTSHLSESNDNSTAKQHPKTNDNSSAKQHPKSNGSAKQHPGGDGNSHGGSGSGSGSGSGQPSKWNRKQSKGKAKHAGDQRGKAMVYEPVKAKDVSCDKQVVSEVVALNPISDANGDAEARPVDTIGSENVEKIGSLSLEDDKGHDDVSSGTPTNVMVTVGTVPITIDMKGGSNPKNFTVISNSSDRENA